MKVAVVLGDAPSDGLQPRLSVGDSERLRLATAALVAGNASRAEAALGRLTSTRLAAPAYNNLGVIHQTRDDLGEAIAYFKKAIELEPRVALYRANLADALRDIGNFERSLEEFQEAAKLAPSSVWRLTNLVGAYSLLGRTDEAVAAAEVVVRQRPGSSYRWVVLSEALMVAGRHDQAQTAAEMAVRLEPCGMSLRCLADVHHDQRNLKEALAYALQSVEADPSDASNLALVGNVYVDLGRPDKAEPYYRRAVACAPDAAQFAERLAALLDDAGNLGEAARWFRRAAELEQESDGNLLTLARIYHQLGQLRSAEQVLRGLVAKGGCATWALLSFVLHDLGSEAASQRCWARVQAGSPQEAEDLAELSMGYWRFERQRHWSLQLSAQAAALDPSNARLRANVAVQLHLLGRVAEAEPHYVEAHRLGSTPDVCAGLGNIYQDRKEYAKAQAMYEHQIKLDPSRPDAYSALGGVLRLQGKFEESIAPYRHAIEMDDRDWAALHGLGHSYRELGRLEEAIDVWRKAFDVRSESDEGVRDLATAYATLRRFAEAEEFYRLWMRLAPEDARCYLSFAVTLSEAGRLDEAMATARRGMELCKGPAEFGLAYGSIGRIHLARGEFDEAEVSLRKGLEFDSSVPIRWFYLGRVLEAKGKPAEARAAYEQVLKRNPGHAGAREALERLRD